MMKASEIKRIRKELGVSRLTLARMLGASSYTVVWRWEHSKTKISRGYQKTLEMILAQHREGKFAAMGTGK